jgi:hypothetical protein
MWTLHDSGTHLFLLFAPHSTPDLPPRAADRPPLQSSACLDASPAPASLPTLAVGPPSSCIESSSYVRIVKLLCGLATSMPVDHRSKAPPPFDRLDSAGTDAGGPGGHHYELCECREPAGGVVSGKVRESPVRAGKPPKPSQGFCAAAAPGEEELCPHLCRVAHRNPLLRRGSMPCVARSPAHTRIAGIRRAAAATGRFGHGKKAA